MQCDIFIEILSRFTKSRNVFIIIYFFYSHQAQKPIKMLKGKKPKCTTTTTIDAGTLMNAESEFAWRSVSAHCKSERSSMEMSLLPKLR